MLAEGEAADRFLREAVCTFPPAGPHQDIASSRLRTTDVHSTDGAGLSTNHLHAIFTLLDQTHFVEKIRRSDAFT